MSTEPVEIAGSQSSKATPEVKPLRILEIPEDQRTRVSPEASGESSTGVIPPWGVNRIWFSAGVVLAGLALGAAFMLDETLHLSRPAAILAGLISAGAFLICFDRSGNWNWGLAVPGIAVAAITALVLKIPVAGGVVGFIVFLLIGYLAVGIRLLLVRMNRLFTT